MRLKIVQFLRDYGLRQVSELQTPRLHAIKKFDFPMETVYHFSDDNTAVIGPSQADPIIAKLKGKVFIEHITELASLEGNPKRTALLPVTLMNDFRKQHRFFKLLRRDESVLLNQQNVAVFNYNMLNPLYRYIASYKATFYRWNNNAATMWEGVANAVKRFPTWNHFIELHVPTTMPTIAQFKQLETQQNQHLLELFNQGNLLNLFDLYRYLGQDRKVSYISKVPREHYARINFFVRVQGSFFVINLGKLDEWRTQTEEEIEAEELEKAKVALESHDHEALINLGFERYTDEFGMEAYFKPEVLQRRFISLMTTLVEYANGNNTLVENDANVQANSLLQTVKEIETPADAPVYTEDSEDTEDDSNSLDTVPGEPVVEEDVTEIAEPLSKVYKTFDLDVLQVTFTPPPELELDTTTLHIENDDMSAVATKVLKVEERRPQQLQEEEFTTGDYMLDGVATRAYKLAKTSMISERSFEQAIDSAMSYETMPDPFGSGLTVKEAMQYAQEDFTVPVDEYPDKTTIMDKAMLKSVHKPMMRKYIKTLLPKDILNGIMFIQRQGVAVTDIKIRENEDVMSHTQTFTVTVKPVRGVSSNLEFTIPVIDKDGRFKSNGVIYRQRIQRADF